MMGLPPVMGQDMRDVRRELADAGDAQVLEVLRYVDTLADRGQADGLMAPLRDRLRKLRPARVLRLPRALFLPLDAVIASPRAWRPGTPAFPRSAIGPFAALVRRDAPELAAFADMVLADASVPEALRLRAAGARLWPEAARLFRQVGPPPEWAGTSLPASEFARLAAACASVLGEALTLRDLTDPAIPAGERDHALTAMLERMRPEGAVPWSMMLTIMLQHMPQAASALRAAPRIGRDMREAADMAVDATIRWVESTEAIEAACLAEAATEIRRQALLLEEMAKDPAARRRVADLSARLRAACCRRFEAAIEDHLRGPLRALDARNGGDSRALLALEADARLLRKLEMEARRLGGGFPPERQLRQAIHDIKARADMKLIDRARLVEILASSQEAAKFLAQAGTCSR